MNPIMSLVKKEWARSGFSIVFLFCLGGPLRAEAVSDTIRDMLGTYCVSCHGEEKSKGDLRLHQLDQNHGSDYDLIDEITALIEDGDMPPNDAEKPLKDSDKAKLLSALTTHLAKLDDTRVAGRYKKLTAREYSNTLKDVFGEPVEKLSDLPFDSEHDIKKLGEHQIVTSYAMKKYYDVANAYLSKHLIHESMLPRETTFTPENGKDFVGRRYTNSLGATAGGGNEPIFIVRSPVTSHAEVGEYELEFDWYCYYGPRDNPKQHERVDPVRTPTIDYHSSNGGVILNPVREFKNDRQSECSMGEPIRIRLDRDMKFLSFRGPGKEFKNFDRKDPRMVKLEQSDLPKNEKRAAMKSLGQEMMKELHGDKQMFLLIKGATFRGPLNKSETPFNRRLFGDIKRSDPIERCFPVIRETATKLFRRPMSEEKVLADYYALARREHAESGNTYQAMKVVLNSMLCSPYFLLKYEGDQARLDDSMIASRLSYFLWNSTPDAALMALAAEGKLQDPGVRRQQALRMLADRARSDRFTRNFTNQWLGLHKFGTYIPNEAYMRATEFARLKPHLAGEPQQFFNEILHENLSALNFIHSDFVVWNHALMSHYGRGTGGLKLGKAGKDEIKEKFYRRSLVQNPDMARGGLMSMTSIMSLTTDGENTQPILRGVWIARRMLGIEIKAPATVPAIEVNLDNVSKPREILDKHKTDPSCYACHVKFDDFGLAMENYDVIGRWKTDYVHPVQNEKGKFELIKKDPIDSLAETPDGQPMPGVGGVKRYLMENKNDVMKHLINELYSYALGREVRYRDRPRIQSLLKAARSNDYLLQDLILGLVVSEGFAER